MLGDRDVLRALLARLSDYIGTLRDFDTMSEERFRADELSQDALERRLQLAIEVSLDIARAIVAMSGGRRAREYASLFRDLGNSGVLTPTMAQRMQAWARFRNRLVHDYDELGSLEAWSARTEAIADLSGYLGAAAAHLRAAEAAGPRGSDPSGGGID